VGLFDPPQEQVEANAGSKKSVIFCRLAFSMQVIIFSLRLLLTTCFSKEFKELRKKEEFEVGRVILDDVDMTKLDNQWQERQAELVVNRKVFDIGLEMPESVLSKCIEMVFRPFRGTAARNASYLASDQSKQKTAVVVDRKIAEDANQTNLGHETMPVRLHMRLVRDDHEQAHVEVRIVEVEHIERLQVGRHGTHRWGVANMTDSIDEGEIYVDFQSFMMRADMTLSFGKDNGTTAATSGQNALQGPSVSTQGVKYDISDSRTPAHLKEANANQEDTDGGLYWEDSFTFPIPKEQGTSVASLSLELHKVRNEIINEKNEVDEIWKVFHIVTSLDTAYQKNSFGTTLVFRFLGVSSLHTLYCVPMSLTFYRLCPHFKEQMTLVTEMIEHVGMGRWEQGLLCEANSFGTFSVNLHE
jgi:hypothetical protein